MDLPPMAGRKDGSFFSFVVRLLRSVQSKSAGVYGVSGTIS